MVGYEGNDAGWDGGMGVTYVSELDQPKLSERVDAFSTYFVGYIQLHHAHVRRAEHGLR